MFKKIIAVSLALIIMIMPMTASAVTWGTVVAQLNATGSYSGDGVEASVEGGAVTVNGSTGASIEGDPVEWSDGKIMINLYTDQVQGANRYAFNNVTLSDEVSIDNIADGSMSVTFGEGTTVNAAVTAGVNGNGSTSVTNNGTVNADFNTYGESGSFSLTNNGTINGHMGGGFGDYENVDPDAATRVVTGVITNNGTVNGDADVYAFTGASMSVVNGENGVVSGTLTSGASYQNSSMSLVNDGTVGNFDSWAEGNGKTITINNGTVENGMYVGANESGTITMENNGTVSGDFYAQSNQSSSMTLVNNGTYSVNFQGSAWDESSLEMTNNGQVDALMNVSSSQDAAATGVNNGTTGAMFGHVMAWDEESEQNVANEGSASTTITNNGTVDRYMISEVWGEGAATGVNNGNVGDILVSAAEGAGAAVSVVNNGTVEADTFADALEGGNAQLINKGAVAGDTYTEVFGSGAAQTVNDGTVDGASFTAAYGSPQTLALSSDSTVSDTSVSGSAFAETVNNGTIAEGMESYVVAGAQTSLVNNGSVPSVSANFEANANGETGSTSLTGSGTTGKLVVEVMAAEGVDTSTAEARQKIADDVASGLTVYAGQLGLTEGNATIEVVIYDETGEAVETVEAEVPLTPVEPKEEEEYVPSEEEIRHEMEEKRKAESLAGVFASPYWCRQMSLGYRSLNFRVFDGEGKNVLIRERLSWIDGGPKKNLNLRVRTDETEGLTIRFDEEVLDILERTEIDTITLLTYTEREPFMQYKTSDLRAAFTQFGLERTDLLVIGGMDDEVMKIGADGQLVPVE